MTEPTVMFHRIGGLARVAICVALGCLTLAAAAQPARIPPGVITADHIADEQKQEIARYVSENIAKVKSDDPKDIREGRRALLEPLGSPDIQVAFRLAYGDLLKPELAHLLNDPAITTSVEAQNRAITALVVAADVATGDSIDLLINALASPREDLRHQAAYGLRRTFEAVQRTPPAAAAQMVQRAIRALGDRLPVEPNSLVLQADINALRQAGFIDRPGMDTRADAINALAKGLNDLIKAREGKMPDRELLNVLLRAATVRDLLQPGKGRLPDERLRQAAAIGGDIVAYVARAVQNNPKGERIPMEPVHPSQIPAGQAPPVRELFAQAAKAGETLVLFAGQVLDPSGAAPPPLNLDQDLRQGTVPGDATFLANAGKLIGPRGMLTQPPFGLRADRFPLK